MSPISWFGILELLDAIAFCFIGLMLLLHLILSMMRNK